MPYIGYVILTIAIYILSGYCYHIHLEENTENYNI